MLRPPGCDRAPACMAGLSVREALPYELRRNSTPIPLFLNISFEDIPPAPTRVIPSSIIAQCIHSQGNRVVVRDRRRVQRNPVIIQQYLTRERETDSFRTPRRTPEAVHLARRVQSRSRRRCLFPVPPGVTTYGRKLTKSFRMNCSST